MASLEWCWHVRQPTTIATTSLAVMKCQVYPLLPHRTSPHSVLVDFLPCYDKKYLLILLSVPHPASGLWPYRACKHKNTFVPQVWHVLQVTPAVLGKACLFLLCLSFGCSAKLLSLAQPACWNRTVHRHLTLRATEVLPPVSRG